MTRWLMVVFLIATAAVAQAQPLVVRTGEHGDFTRLVLQLPNGADWDVNTGAGTVTVGIRDPSVTFDLSEAFQRIDRSRIADLTAIGNGSLVVKLACRCEADSFLVDSNLLVLDLSEVEGAALPEAEPRQSEIQSPQPSPAAAVSPLVADLSRVRVGQTAGIGPGRQTDPLLPKMRNPDNTVSRQTQQAETEDSEPTNSAPDLGEQIASDLAVAATRGLLSPSIQTVQSQSEPNRGEDLVPPGEARMSADSADLARQLVAGLTNATHETLRAGRVSIGADTCVPDSKLDIAHWSEPESEAVVVMSKRRSALFGEFDRIDQSALKSYARSLLHYGFGAEAKVILEMSEGKPDALMTSLSFLVDGRPDPGRFFAGQESCAGAAALWAVLSTQNLSSSAHLETDLILQSFEALPKHLKEHLGPLLAERLTGAGFTDAAREVYVRMERAFGSESDRVALGRANMDLKDGNLAEAETRLKPLSENGTPQTPEAIKARISLAEAQNELLPERIVELADAYANEYRNTDQGAVLWQAHIRSLLQNGAFDQAFTAMDDAKGIPDDIQAETRELAFHQLVNRAEDLTFLKHALSTDHPHGGERGVTNATILSIAQRLVGLGMADVALEQLDLVAGQGDNRAIRVIRAAALMDLGEPEEAEIQLIGLRGEDVERMRAEARRQMGDHVFAERIFREVGAEDAAATSAWLSGNWEEMANGSDSVMSEAARMLQQAGTTMGDTDVTLRAAEDIFAESESSRNTIRSLLETTRVAPDS
ncbi:MAG: hypothetical protein ACU0CR_11435 [Sagittula sp.]|uniref:hypothetical protein n=2 Tax=Sagittula sp. TaxID=2038081 RepID=UPI004058CC96